MECFGWVGSDQGPSFKIDLYGCWILLVIVNGCMGKSEVYRLQFKSISMRGDTEKVNPDCSLQRRCSASSYYILAIYDISGLA